MEASKSIESIISFLQPPESIRSSGDVTWGTDDGTTKIDLRLLHTTGNITVKGKVILVHPDDTIHPDIDQDDPKLIVVSCNQLIFQEGSSISTDSAVSIRAKLVIGNKMIVSTTRGKHGKNGADPAEKPAKNSNGTNGARGADGRDAKCPKRATPGGRGGDGGNGRGGTNGSDGPNATSGYHAASLSIAIDSFSATTIPFLSAVGGDGGHGGQGQEGGDGGNGGRGGDGGQGGDGGCFSSNKPGGNGGTGGTGGDGGDGGDGGRGGNGGDGGSVRFYYGDLPITWDINTDGGRKGIGGDGGKGGEGGERGFGGRGGLHGEPDDEPPAANGQDGQKGARGQDGRDGPDGIPGDKGKVGYIELGQESPIAVIRHYIAFHPEEMQEELFDKTLNHMALVDEQIK